MAQGKDLSAIDDGLPQFSSAEAVIRVDAIVVPGRAGSSLHKILTGGVAGTVESLGQDVKNISIGDKVTVARKSHCSLCEFCKAGRRNICVASVPRRFYKRNHLLYCVQSANACYRLPHGIPVHTTVFLKEVSNAVYACQRALMAPGTTVLICGSDSNCLLMIKVAKAFGAEHVCIAAKEKELLQLAEEHGADTTLVINTSGLNWRQITKQVQLVIGKLADATIDCTMSRDTLQIGMYGTKKGGIVVWAGCQTTDLNECPSDVIVPVMDGPVRKEVDIRPIAVHSTLNSYEEAMTLLMKEKIDVGSLVGKSSSLEMALAHNGSSFLYTLIYFHT